MTEHNAAHDLGTSNGSRAYLAAYFAKQIGRHDFKRYINEIIAADFACALAQHLSKLRAEGVQAGDERAAFENAARMRGQDLARWPAPLTEYRNSRTQAAWSAWSDRAALARAPVAGEAHRIFLVPTGEVYCGQETYTRHEGQPPVNTDNECLYAAPQASEAVRNTQADKDGGDCAKGAEDEPIAWESTTAAYIKFITDSRYQKFSPAVRKWYRPYRCSTCAALSPTQPTEQGERDE